MIKKVTQENLDEIAQLTNGYVENGHVVFQETVLHSAWAGDYVHKNIHGRCKQLTEVQYQEKYYPDSDYTIDSSGIRYTWDGDQICAVKHDDFINLQESPAGFGSTKEEACANLVLACVDHFQDWLKGRPNDLDYQKHIVEGEQ